jgi:hypothetical protein
MKKIEFNLNHPEVLDEDLVDACRGMVNGWGDRLIKKLILEGLAGWVDPALSFRQAYYNVTADTDGTKHGLDQRYSYMTAAARIEEAIPDQVLAFMKRSGYISIYSWDGVKRDLYVLIVVIEDFMRGYAKVSHHVLCLTKLMPSAPNGMRTGNG